jgi:GNAT superfamily N-acetyltransferase
MTATADIAQATGADVETLAWVIAEAFEPMPACAALVPEPDDRRRVLAANFGIAVEHAVRHGQVDTIWDRSAVAVWFPRGDAAPADPENYDARLTAACGPYADRFRYLDALFAAHHPAWPHHHLAFLAVTPQRQGTGLGSALLDHHHRLLDAQGTPAYVEASTRRNRALYLRHGYQPKGDPFDLPNGALFWPMWRPANPPARKAAP